jgi:DUF1680 family protein
MYNALLGSIDLEGKHFYYDNPLDARVARYAWHVCPCCVGNIPRTLLMLPTWTYARSEEGLWVNMYVGSTITVENVAGTDVEVVQRTDYPWDGKVSITVNPKAPKRFAVRLRVPDRAVSALYRAAPGVGGIGAVTVNGARVKAPVEHGYAVVSRAWKAGDRIEFELPLKPQRVHASERIEATRGKVALRYGPLIYNVESEDQDITKALGPDTPLAAEWREELLGGIVVIKGTFSDGTPLLAIPNFARMNRRPGLDYPPSAPPAAAGGRRAEPPPHASAVWIREG